MDLEKIEPAKDGIVHFSITDEVIANMKEQFLPLKIDGIHDKAGYLAVHEARMKVKTVRIDVEKTRKELKEESLQRGRLIDGEAKRITALLEPIENHLETQQRAIDAEKERLREERERAEKKRVADRLAALVEYGLSASNIDIAALGIISDEKFAEELARAKTLFEERKAKEEEEAKALAAIAAEEARLKAEEDARLASVAAEQETERLRLEAIDKEQKERLAAIRAREEVFEAKVRAEEAEKVRQAEIEAAVERAKVEAQEKAEREARELEAAKKAAVEEDARLEALRPDYDKLIDFAAELASIATKLPDVSKPEARVVVAFAHQQILELAGEIRTRTKELRKPKKRTANV